jgi:WD40-like Beta Propeller Repeat
MRRTRAAILAVPLLVLSPVRELSAGVNIGWRTAVNLARPQYDRVRLASPEATSAREELEQLQKHNGLALGVVDLGHANHREKVVYSVDAPPNPPSGIISFPTPKPQAISTREELERLQKQNGLTFSFVDFQGIEVLNFKKKAFAFRALSLQGNDLVGAVSRDGTEIAVFPPHDTEILSLIVMHPDGSSRREYSGIRASSQVCWSYDGAKLAMVTRETTLQVIELGPGLAQETPLQNLSNRKAITSQCFSPDGKQIVYESNDGYVSEYDVNNRRATRLAKGESPTWSPDGNWIAYRDAEAYYAIRPSGEGRRKLFHKTRAISALYWSPDSRFVAYVHQDFFGTLDVEIYHLMIRRLADGVEDSMGGAAPGYNYQWVRNPQLLQWVDSGGQED